MPHRSPTAKFGLVLMMLALSLGASLLIGADKKKKSNKASAQSSAAAAIPQMDEEKRALHALNRLTFGPRPGDMEMVSKMGVDKWIEQQLHPDKIDNSALEARLAPLLTLHMSTQNIVESFPPPQVLRAIADGRMQMPSDPAKRAIYQRALEMYQNRKENKEEKAASKQDNSQPAQSQQAQDPNMDANMKAGAGNSKTRTWMQT
ncbi:MAG: hypothetical protein DMG67_10355 [Acidobacteria bacterium]|nr:MAG: hypothetical protein DMG67_10355 [Acidobacteriota bacterium]